MANLDERILAEVGKKHYQPIKAKALSRKLGLPASEYAAYRRVLRTLLSEGRVELGRNNTVRAAPPHGTVVGIYRRMGKGSGFVRPHLIDGQAGVEVRVREGDEIDASTGDEVLVKVVRKPSRPDQGPVGIILRVLQRATRQFVGTYHERDGKGLVRVDGTVFSHSIYVGDPGAKGVKPDDKVVIDMIRFPTAEDRGEAVLTEVLGPRGKPGVDTLSIMRAFNLPDKFPEEVLEEARLAAAAFDEDDLTDRDDLTATTTITIDPIEARDFDDAISLEVDPKSKHWILGVHIADVAYFAPAGGALDREARNRATSIYLPQRVIPMFPEIISNSLASLQQDKVRFTKTVFMEFTAQGQSVSTRFANSAIKVNRRFHYEEVSKILAEEGKHKGLDPDVHDLLFRMRDLAVILRKRRTKRGALELHMPEAELEYDNDGRVTGAHFVEQDISHQMIEAFMLSANEAVAAKLTELGAAFLRRCHPAPLPDKLKSFAEFARILGYKIERHTDRFALQRVLTQSASRPDVYAVHYALLRSLKQAVYSPQEEGHYALASDDYCHFTSPIRRYPDLAVHRLLGRWIKTKKVGSDTTELAALGEHCSKMERRAETAERELVKLRLLTYMSNRIGEVLEVVVTGVADYGFFGQAEKIPVEGRVHVSTLNDDYYYYDDASHSLIGQRTKKRYRLGDKVKVEVVRVDLQRRQLDFRVSKKK